jgi:hypothetical protein
MVILKNTLVTKEECRELQKDINRNEFYIYNGTRSKDPFRGNCVPSSF